MLMTESAVPSCPGPLNLNDEALRRDPYPIYRWYRQYDPVHRLPDSGKVPRYLVTRWDDVESGLKNSKLRREVHKDALWNRPIESVDPDFLAYASVLRTWPLFKDPPNHAKVRRPVNRILDESMTAAARPLIAGAVEHTLDQSGISREWIDVVQSFTSVLPVEIGRRLFGLQHVDVRTLSGWLQSIGLAIGNVFQPDRIRAANQSILQLELHLSQVLKDCRRGNDGAPMPMRVLQLETDGLLEDAQLVPVCILLLQAAQDSVTGALANGVITFLRHPAQLQWCLQNDDGFRRAVDEVLRFESPVQQITRHAVEEIRIRDKAVQAGEGVTFLLGAANRDPEIFVDPDEFIVTRAGKRNAAFGHGPHTCPGIALGSEVAAAGWRGLFQRFPGLEYFETGVQWRAAATFRTLAALPVRTQ